MARRDQLGGFRANQEESNKIWKAYNAGGNYLDTSNRYQESQSEQWVGDFIQRERDFFVVGTKYSLGDGAGDFNGVGKPTNQKTRTTAVITAKSKALVEG